MKRNHAMGMRDNAWKNIRLGGDYFHKDMSIRCRGLCYRFVSHDVKVSQKYQRGQKRCTPCSVFIQTNDARCPCYGSLLRTHSRNKPKARTRVNETLLE